MGVVKTFSDAEDGVQCTAWAGPFHAGLCTVEILGPLQVVFACLAALAAAFLVIEYWRDGIDAFRFAHGSVLLAACGYLAWLAKHIYVIKAFRKEVETFESLNGNLRSELHRLEIASKYHTANNQAQAQLNLDLSQRVLDLIGVERKLLVLSRNCAGSVMQARKALQRLERNLKLNTLNSAVLLFDRADADRNGRVDGEDAVQFIDSLAFLWSHLPSFDSKLLTSTMLSQGGVSIGQVHGLIDVIMKDVESIDPVQLARALEATSEHLPEAPKVCEQHRGNAALPNAIVEC